MDLQAFFITVDEIECCKHSKYSTLWFWTQITIMWKPEHLQLSKTEHCFNFPSFNSFSIGLKKKFRREIIEWSKFYVFDIINYQKKKKISGALVLHCLQISLRFTHYSVAKRHDAITNWRSLKCKAISVLSCTVQSAIRFQKYL